MSLFEECFNFFKNILPKFLANYLKNFLTCNLLTVASFRIGVPSILFFVKEGWKKFFFSKKPKFHPKKKDEWQFSIFWGKLQQNSRPFSYFNFKNWYIKLVSELMSMLNYTEIVIFVQLPSPFCQPGWNFQSSSSFTFFWEAYGASA